MVMGERELQLANLLSGLNLTEIDIYEDDDSVANFLKKKDHQSIYSDSADKLDCIRPTSTQTDLPDRVHARTDCVRKAAIPVEHKMNPSFGIQRVLGYLLPFLFGVAIIRCTQNMKKPFNILQPTLTSVTDGEHTVYQDSKPASSFFVPSSSVVDAYTGDLSVIPETLKRYDFVFVMYYAHWSESCLRARAEYDKASQTMLGKVPFLAVNCWDESSICREKYKFFSFPSFYVYASGMKRGFLYSGVLKAQYFIRFIRSLLNPVIHIHNTSQLLSFVSGQDSSLVGYFNLSTEEPHSSLQQFYFASMRSIEKDFTQPIRFGVLSDKDVAAQLSLDDVNPLILIRSVTDDVVYPSTNNFTSLSIAGWLSSNYIKPVVSWYFNTGTKTSSLYATLSSGPTVILFTSFNPCYTRFTRHSHGYSILRELVLAYHSCNVTDGSLRHKIAGHIQSLASDHNHHHVDVCDECDADDRTETTRICFSLNSTETSVCEMCTRMSHCLSHCDLLARAGVSFAERIHKGMTCQMSRLSYYPQHTCELCCGVKPAITSLTLARRRRLTDEFVMANLKPSCSTKTYTAQQTKESTVSSEVKGTQLPPNWDTCSFNRTVNFLAMDKSLHSDFARRLGISLNISEHHVAMIDLKAEAHYIMKASFSKENLIEFLEDFTRGKLKRTLMQSKPSCRASEEQLSVLEVAGTQFEMLLAKHDMDLVVLFFAKWCLFCKSINHIFLSVAKYFGTSENIRFIRVNSAENHLPWKYTVSSVPTIVFFPLRGDAVAYAAQEITVSGLVSFILEHCSTEVALGAVLRHPHNDQKARLESTVRNLQQKLSMMQNENLGDEASMRDISAVRLQLLNAQLLHRSIYMVKDKSMSSIKQSINQWSHYASMLSSKYP